MFVPVTATWAPCSSGMVDRSSVSRAWDLLEDLLTLGGVLLACLLDDQIVDFLVGVAVVDEVAVAEERGQVVVRIGVVREPAELVDRVRAVGVFGDDAFLVVLRPFGLLQVDLEQAVGLQLGLDGGVLVGGRGA